MNAPEPTARLKPLNPPPSGWWHTRGDPVDIGSQTLLLLPFAAPVGRSRGRRYRVAIGNSKPRTRVVLSVGGRAALVRPSDVDAVAGPVEVRIQALAAVKPRRLPADARALLAERGGSEDQLPEHELVQLILMIGESADAEIRRARVEAAVAAIVDRRRGPA